MYLIYLTCMFTKSVIKLTFLCFYEMLTLNQDNLNLSYFHWLHVPHLACFRSNSLANRNLPPGSSKVYNRVYM